MISKLPLFSGFTTMLWSCSLWACIATGFLHLPIADYLPFSLPVNLPLGRLHCFAGASALFFATYGTIVWLLEGRRLYRLTPLGYFEAFGFACVLITGMLLAGNVASIVPLYGSLILVVKSLHLAAALGILIGLVIFVLMQIFYHPFSSYRVR